MAVAPVVLTCVRAGPYQGQTVGRESRDFGMRRAGGGRGAAAAFPHELFLPHRRGRKEGKEEGEKRKAADGQAGGQQPEALRH